MTSIPVPLSPRAQEYFNQVFKPKYDQLQQAIQQTPLTILIWGSASGDPLLGSELVQIRDELRRRGHAAFFSAELAETVPAPMSQKGIEFLQAQASDLIIGILSSHSPDSEEQDFFKYRTINFKMLIFIDERAKDDYLYRGALNELKTLYNNVETYKYPDDLEQGIVLNKVLEKVGVLQMVKYRALENASSWGLLPSEEGKP